MRWLAPIPIFLPLLVAAVLVAGSAILSRRVLDAAGILTAAAVAAACGMLLVRALGGILPVWFGGWMPNHGVAIGIALAVDPFGAGAALLAAVLVLAAMLFSWRHFETAGSFYHALMLVFLSGMAGFALSGDLFNMFVFFELMSVAAYALTGYRIEERAPLQGALNFGVTNTIGGFMILLGTGLLYGRTGALNLAQLGESLAGGPADGLVIAAFTLLVGGFLVKGAAVPFHFWLADAHAVAPTPVCVLFSGVMVELGLYAVARVYSTVFSGVIDPLALRQVLLSVGAVTAVVGGVMCFAQRHLKRLLAFSTVGHSGLFLVGIALLSPGAMAGAALYVLGHGLVKGALFICVGILLHRLGSIDEDDLLGRGRRLPFTGLLFLVGGLALAGLPPFGVEAGKHLIEDAAGVEGYGWVAFLFALTSILTGGAVIRAGLRIFGGVGGRERTETPAEEEARREGRETRGARGRTPVVMVVPATLLIAAALAIGLSPGLEERVHAAAHLLLDRQAYAAAVLQGTAPQPPAPVPPPPGGLAVAGATVLGAVAVAVGALQRQRLSAGVRGALWRLAGPPVDRLRTLHSGMVTDYVAWLTVGLAVLGGGFALTLR